MFVAVQTILLFHLLTSRGMAVQARAIESIEHVPEQRTRLYFVRHGETVGQGTVRCEVPVIANFVRMVGVGGW